MKLEEREEYQATCVPCCVVLQDQTLLGRVKDGGVDARPRFMRRLPSLSMAAPSQTNAPACLGRRKLGESKQAQAQAARTPPVVIRAALFNKRVCNLCSAGPRARVFRPPCLNPVNAKHKNFVNRLYSVLNIVKK